MLQERWFWFQGPAWQWKRENFRRFRIGGIICWWFVPDARIIANGWIKYRAFPKIRRPKPYQLTADLTLECSDESMFHPLSHTAWKNPFCCAETASNSALNCRRVVVFHRLWANAEPISNRAFSCSNFYTKWWIHCLLIYLRCHLSHAISFTIGENHFVDFFYVF